MFTGVETEVACLNQQRGLVLAAHVAARQDKLRHTWNSLHEHHIDTDLLRVAPRSGPVCQAPLPRARCLFSGCAWATYWKRAPYGCQSSF